MYCSTLRLNHTRKCFIVLLLLLIWSKISSPSGLLTSANSLCGESALASSNSLFKECYYHGVSDTQAACPGPCRPNCAPEKLCLDLPPQALPDLLCTGALLMSQQPGWVLCAVFLDVKLLLLLDDDSSSWDEKEPGKNCPLGKYKLVDNLLYLSGQGTQSFRSPQSWDYRCMCYVISAGAISLVNLPPPPEFMMPSS